MIANIKCLLIAFIKKMNGNFEKNEQVKAALIELAFSSSIHGIPNIAKTKRTIIKIIWLFSLISSFGICCNYTIDSVKEYLAYNTITDTEIFYENPTEFPAVTFCNLQGLSKNYSLEETLLLCVYNRGIFL